MKIMGQYGQSQKLHVKLKKKSIVKENKKLARELDSWFNLQHCCETT